MMEDDPEHPEAESVSQRRRRRRSKVKARLWEAANGVNGKILTGLLAMCVVVSFLYQQHSYGNLDSKFGQYQENVIATIKEQKRVCEKRVDGEKSECERQRKVASAKHGKELKQLQSESKSKSEEIERAQEATASCKRKLRNDSNKQEREIEELRSTCAAKVSDVEDKLTVCTTKRAQADVEHKAAIQQRTTTIQELKANNTELQNNLNTCQARFSWFQLAKFGVGVGAMAGSFGFKPF